MTPDNIVDEWDERRAIMEISAGMTRDEATRAAWDRMAEKYTRRDCARALVEAIKQGKA